MKYFIFLLSFASIIQLHAQQWQQLSDFPGNGRDDGTTFTLGTKVYCGLGMNPWFGCNGDFSAFDLDTETWSDATVFPAGEERQYANGFSYNGAGYVFGGMQCGSAYLNDLWKFDPILNTWTEQTSLPSAGRAGATCFVIGDTAYIIGGKTATENAMNEVWAYNLIAQTWTQKADLPFDGIWRGVAFSWNGNGILGLGKDNQENLSGNFYQYDPQQDSWQIIPGLTMEGTTYTAATQIENLAFLYGGMNASGTYLNTFTRIDLETFEAHILTSFPSEARRGGMAFAGDDEFYLTTGVSATGRLKETWKAGYILGSEEKSIEQPKIFPNPSEGTFQVISAGTIDEVVITDLAGKVVYRKTFSASQANIETGLPAGAYFLLVLPLSPSKGENLMLNKLIIK